MHRYSLSELVCRRWIFGGTGAVLALGVGLAGCSNTIGGPGPSNDGPGADNGGSAGTGSAQGGSSGTSGSSGASGAGAAGAAGTSGAAGTGGEPPLPPDDVERDCTAMNGVMNEGLTRLRRMTRVEYNNTVRDLVGAGGAPADAISPDERIGPFASNAIAPITELIVEQHMEVAAALARDAATRMATLAPCDLAADSGTTCATRFITEFGQRAYRRPLEADEVTRYVALYNVGKQGAGGASNGFRLVVEAMLQAPSFLYHSDLGTSGVPSPTPVPLTGYELASRLSYFLWNSMPDAELFALAQSGALADPATLPGQVERLLADPKASATIGLFHRQWLELDDLSAKDKDATVYPLYSAGLFDAMLEETTLFSDYVVRQGDGLLRTLLTSNLAFPTGNLFDVYGVTEPANYRAGTPVSLNQNERAGILTQGAFLARHSHRDQTSPVHRGIIVRENILCQPLEPPPAGVNAVVPPPNAATSTRERFAQHSADDTCAGCHVSMDPIGLGFENYDAIGAYRTVDGLGPVDARGEVVGVRPDLEGPFNGALELTSKLSQSEEVRNCVAAQWFRFSLGRMETENDACSMQAIRLAFRDSGGNVRTLLARIALSDAFRHVRLTEN